MPVNMYGNPEREANLVYDRQPGPKNKNGQGTNVYTPQFGGIYGLASSLANQYGNQAEGMKNRVIGNPYSGQDIPVEAQARQQQLAALEAQRRMAMGIDPSVAEQQYRAGMLNAAQNQNAMAQSSMGGGSAMAMAQRMGAQNNAQNAIIGNQQAQMIRAQEMAAARERYAAGLQGLRTGDQNMWNAMQGREMGQAQLNDQGVLQSQGMANNILGGQLNADAAAYAAQSATAADRKRAEFNRRYGMSSAVAKGAVQAGLGVVTAGAGSGAANDAMNQGDPGSSQYSGDGG